MMIRNSLLATVAIAALLTAHAAHSQPSIAAPVVIGAQVPVTSANETTGPTFQPTTGYPLEAAVNCGAASSQLLTASSASVFVLIQNPTANPVWIDLTGAAAVTAAPSYLLGASTSLNLSIGSGFVPRSAITCISSTITVTSSISVAYR
jgi:hypothetical protein